VGKQNDRQPGGFFLDLMTQRSGTHVRQPRHGDHHVEGLGVKGGKGLFGRRDPGQARGLAEVEPPILVDDPFGKPTVLFHDPGIVGCGYQKDIAHLAGHQLVEQLEAGIGFVQKWLMFNAMGQLPSPVGWSQMAPPFESAPIVGAW
jgi:hypothetical protein